VAASGVVAAMTDLDPDPSLRDLTTALTESGIPYMVVGSAAGTFHGHPRSTIDLDIVIDPTASQLQQLLQRLPPERFYADPDVARDALRHRGMFNVIDMLTGWKIDLIIRKARPFSIEELKRRQRGTIFGVEVDTATAEDTIVAKLEWAKTGNSERQLHDVAAILKNNAVDLAYVERWIDELELRAEWDRARSLATS
jgi:hypothetical protein